MLTRYGTLPDGTQTKIAEIYTSQEHSIDLTHIDFDAMKIIRRLRGKGYQAYIVGGAVRDLLLQKQPKDFDIVTDALPRKIRKLFWNSRVIGKRFRLVHIHFGEKIIEVSTFRSTGDEGNNVYGKMNEDAERRDFSFNALYLCPVKNQVVDYVGGFRDIQRGRVRPLMDPDASFEEDPVRMIRAVKYGAVTGFKLPTQLQNSIKKQAYRLGECSPSRLTEEVFKILETGWSEKIFYQCERLKILPQVLPVIAVKLDSFRKPFFQSLRELDTCGKEGEPAGRGPLIAALVRGMIFDDSSESVQEMFHRIKKLIQPITPPNKEVERACSILLH